MTRSLQGTVDDWAASLRGDQPSSRPVSSALDPEMRRELWGAETVRFLITSQSLSRPNHALSCISGFAVGGTRGLWLYPYAP